MLPNNIEIIIIDDGSNDNSLELLNNHSKAKIINNKKIMEKATQS